MAGTAQSERGVDSLSRLFRENRQEEAGNIPMEKSGFYFDIWRGV